MWPALSSNGKMLLQVHICNVRMLKPVRQRPKPN